MAESVTPRLRLCPLCGRPNVPERVDIDGAQCRCTMEDIVGSPKDWLIDMAADIEEEL